MKYQDGKLYWTYQHGAHWLDDYIGPDSMTRWILEASDGFTAVGLLKISESIRAYVYLILSSQVHVQNFGGWQAVSLVFKPPSLPPPRYFR